MDKKKEFDLGRRQKIFVTIRETGLTEIEYVQGYNTVYMNFFLGDDGVGVFLDIFKFCARNCKDNERLDQCIEDVEVCLRTLENIRSKALVNDSKNGEDA